MSANEAFGRRKVLVLGHGIAGTAAAWRAADRGASVFVAASGAGASVLATGALDDVPWEDLARAEAIERRAGAQAAHRLASPLPDLALAFAGALGTWRIPSTGAPLPRLATLAGRTRPARGHDLSLLDLASIPPGLVAVPRADRAAWDADSLATFWSDDPFARSRGLRFKAIDAPLLRFDGEDRISDADLAARHDDPARVAWLADRLREAFARDRLSPVAVILGPWLGASAPRAAALSDRLQMPCGEAVATAGGPAGLRFARARDRLLEASGVRVITARILSVAPPERPAPPLAPDSGRPRAPESMRVPESARLAEQRATVTVDGAEPTLRADRLVLACGGLTGGGLVHDPPERHAGGDMPDRGHPSFRFSFTIAATADGRPYLVSGGARAEQPSSMFGPTLDLTAWPTPGQTGTLESVGVACETAPDGSTAHLAAPYLAAAGDVVADRPRTALLAVRSGLAAGDWAAT